MYASHPTVCCRPISGILYPPQKNAASILTAFLIHFGQQTEWNIGSKEWQCTITSYCNKALTAQSILCGLQMYVNSATHALDPIFNAECWNSKPAFPDCKLLVVQFGHFFFNPMSQMLDCDMSALGAGHEERAGIRWCSKHARNVEENTWSFQLTIWSTFRLQCCQLTEPHRTGRVVIWMQERPFLCVSAPRV